MCHYFDVDVAKQYGVDEAIVISNFQFWISHNAANKKNFHNGKFWTYNSYPALALIFPYWSAKQIRRIMDNLVSKEVLEVGIFNKQSFDKTNWYCFTDEVKWLSNIPSDRLGASVRLKGEIPSAHLGAWTDQMGRPIPDTVTTNVNTDSFIPPLANANGGIPVGKNEPTLDSNIEKKKKSAAKKKKDDEATEHWQCLVDIWFKFYEHNYKVEPTFNGAARKSLKEIINRLREISFEKNIDKQFQWTEDYATRCFKHFLIKAISDDWRKQNFLLHILYSQFDSIIQKDETATRKTNASHHPTASIEDVFNEFGKRFNS